MSVRHLIRPTIPFLSLVALGGCTSEHVMEQVTSTSIAHTEGGTATSHDGRLSLTFAPGALAEDTEIRIETLAGLTHGELATEAYELSPHGITFGGAVQLELKAPGVTEELEIVNLDGAEPVPVEGSTHDLQAEVVRATLAHFSAYGGMRRYRPCAGKTCGVTCSPCNPARPSCQPAGNFACDPNGACIAASNVMCSVPDAGVPVDAGGVPDAGNVRDAGAPPMLDAGPNGRPDSGSSGGRDAGTGFFDAGNGRPDAGTGTPDAGAGPVVHVEQEPNNDLRTANVIALNPMASTTVMAGLFPQGDVDVFRIAANAPGQTVRVRTYGIQGQPSACGGIDTVLTAYDVQGQQLAQNDDISGQNFCSEVIVPATGTLYFEVSAFRGVVQQYFLHIELQ